MGIAIELADALDRIEELRAQLKAAVKVIEYFKTGHVLPMEVAILMAEYDQLKEKK